MIRSVFKGSGSALPARCMTNDELAERVDTSDEWIRERTGIGTRYVAGEGETTGTLATAAARAALADAGIAASEVDLIVLATATPDHTFPATATAVPSGFSTGARSAPSVTSLPATISPFAFIAVPPIRAPGKEMVAKARFPSGR